MFQRINSGLFNVMHPIKIGTTAIIVGTMFLTGCSNQKVTQTVESSTDSSQAESSVAKNTQTVAQTENPADAESKPSVKSTTDDTSAKPITAQAVTFKSVPLNYKLPKQVADACAKEPTDDQIRCPEIEIELAEVEPKWIEQVLNLQITNDNSPKHIKFKQELDEFAISQIEDESLLGYSMQIAPNQLPAHNNVAQFSIVSNLYLGGAHGMPTIDYLLFDMTLQSQIDLTDVLDYNEGEFFDLARQAFLEYLSEELDIAAPKEVADYEQTWSFTLSDVFYFDDEKGGLVLVYQPYQLGSYAQGFIELVIPYSDLNGVVKPQYLPK